MKASDILAQLTANRRRTAAGPDAAGAPLPGAPAPLVIQQQPGLVGSAVVGGLRGAQDWLAAQGGGPPREADDFGYEHVRRTAEAQQGRNTGPFAAEEPQFGRPTAPRPTITAPVTAPERREEKPFMDVPDKVRTRFGLLPGYRRGGQMEEGVPAVVGEEEPEVVIPRQSSVAIPVSEIVRAVQGQQQSAVSRVAPVPEAARPTAQGVAGSILGTVEALKAQSGAATPVRTPAPLRGLGIPSDAEELPKVPAVAGVDENYTTPAPGEQVRPRTVTPQGQPQLVPPSAPAPVVPAPVQSVEDVGPETRQPVEAETSPASGDASAQTRARVASPVDWLRKRLSEESARQPADTNGGWKSAALSALITGADALGQSGDWRSALAAAGTGAVVGGVDKSFDESLQQRRYVARLQQQYEAETAREAERLKLEGAQADVRLRNEQADYWGQRPEADAAKREDARAKETRSRVFRVLSSLKGQRLDPASPRVQRLQADADAAGIPFDVDVFNESKGNLVRYTKTDPEHPEQVVTVERNLVTGEETVLGQKGFQATRNAEGMTTAEVAADEDRDAARDNTEAYRKQLLGLSTDRLHLQMSNGLGTQAKRIFDTRTHGLFEQRRQFETQINGLRTRSAKKEIPPADAERRIEEIQKKVDGLTEQIDDARSEALGSMGAGAAPSSSSAPAGRRYAGQRMPRANLPAAAKALGLSESDAEALITREGGVVY